MKMQGYNAGHTCYWNIPVSKTKNAALAKVGERLAQLRKAAGYTQVQLADEMGISRRIIAYYESEAEHPPTHLLPQWAKALGLSVDQLLGTKPAPSSRKPRNTRLQRRLEQVDQLGAKEKRQALQFLDTLIEREKWKKKASG